MHTAVTAFGIINFIFGAVFLIALIFDTIFLFHSRGCLQDYSTLIYLSVFYLSSTGLFYSGLSALFRKSKEKIIPIISSLALLVGASGIVSGIGMERYSALRFFSQEYSLPLYAFIVYAVLQVFYRVFNRAGRHSL